MAANHSTKTLECSNFTCKVSAFLQIGLQTRKSFSELTKLNQLCYTFVDILPQFCWYSGSRL